MFHQLVNLQVGCFLKRLSGWWRKAGHKYIKRLFEMGCAVCVINKCASVCESLTVVEDLAKNFVVKLKQLVDGTVDHQHHQRFFVSFCLKH